MITAKAFAGKHYAVLGLARSGRATVEALLASGAKVTAWDDHSDRCEETVDAVQDASRDWESCELTIEDFVSSDLSQFDSIVVTPGLPLNRHPIAARAKAAGVEIIGDIELFARARADLPPHKVVGITGTNGKSTTTALVHHILQTAGVPSLMGGNIGLPILAHNPLPAGGVYVLELSSYQLDLTQSLDCDVAVLLNITPDHLDRYDGFEAYAASKARLFEMQSRSHIAVFNYDDQDVWNLLDRFDEGTWSYKSRPTLLAPEGSDRMMSLSLSLSGPHNRVNAMCAEAASEALGLSGDQIGEALRTYPGLPHRMERVAERDSVLFVNDSKATNAEAAAPALAAFERVRWIVGGQAKGEMLGDTAKHLDHVVKAYAIGEAAPMFARLLREASVDVAECGTLEVAVKTAASEAQAGDTVLLSPACASFDQFSDFEARGNAFRAAVEAL